MFCENVDARHKAGHDERWGRDRGPNTKGRIIDPALCVER
jgi:hypothetical protein